MRAALLAVCLSAIAIIILSVPSLGQDAIECPEGGAPSIDGTIEDPEWADADNMTLQVPLEDDCTVFYKHDGEYLYVAFQFDDGHNTNVPDTRVMLDTDNDMADSPQDDDHELYINPDNGGTRERRGNGNDWDVVTTDDWTGAWNDTDSETWSTEYSISFRKLMGNGTSETLGLGFIVYGNLGASTGWPDGADEDTPSSWGNMTFAGGGLAIRTIAFLDAPLIIVEAGKQVHGQVTIENTGTEEETIDIGLEGEVAPWASLERSDFTVQPGTAATINITFAAPMDTAEGTYGLNVTGTARSGANASKTITVRVTASSDDGRGSGDGSTPGFDPFILIMAVAVILYVHRRR
jgi:hypothetical protein